MKCLLLVMAAVLVLSGCNSGPLASAPATPNAQERQAMASGFAQLSFLEAAITVLDDNAQKVESAGRTPVGFDTMRPRYTLNMEYFADSSSVDVLDAEWEEARKISARVEELISQWETGAIDSAALIAQLEGPRTDMDHMLDSLQQELARSYGFDAALLERSRQDAVKEMKS
jgi:phage baseplate assembly protein W